MRPMPRFRLIDGVIVAAIALLSLKVGALVYSGSVIAARDPAPETQTTDGLPEFGHVLAHARTNYVPSDPTTTGSVPAAKTGEHGAGAKPQEPSEGPKDAAATDVLAQTPAKASAETAILEHLGARRDQLQERAREMETRRGVIEESERRLDARMQELKALEDKQQATVTKRADAEAASLKNLVTMYETMKPKEAARVFDRLPQDVLVPVVVQMNPRKMADVLAAMSPETAEKLTVALARRAAGSGPASPAAGGLPPGELPAISPTSVGPPAQASQPAQSAGGSQPRLRGH